MKTSPPAPPPPAGLDPGLEAALAGLRGARVVVITGAGISAESGIPTFRGEEGYWTVGARVYQPMEMATQAAFRGMPREVWRWYLHRLGVCRAHAPNPAHAALVRLEAALGDRFLLGTQNVDGLHLRAGSSAARTCQVHGNIGLMRPASPARGEEPLLVPVPEDLVPRERDAPLDDAEWARLVVPPGDRPARPHVLWFDEYYDEALYRSSTVLEAVAAADLLLVVGSSGAANLPMQALATAAEVGATIVDVDPHDNPFGHFAGRYPRGHWARGTATRLVPAIVDLLSGS